MSQIWQDLFVVGVPVAEKIIRPILVYFFLLIGLRLARKRELAQLNPSFFPKEPTPDVARHEELLVRLDQLAAEFAALKTSLNQASGK
jgi:hypothetical protein